MNSNVFFRLKTNSCVARNLLIGFLLSLAFIGKGQEVNQNGFESSSKEFQNQGEQEDFWAKQLFTKKYRKKTYQRYSGSIQSKGDTLTYGSGSLIYWGVDSFKRILSLGILYPEIIVGSQFDGELTISNFEELVALEVSDRRKRFRFWLQEKGLKTLINPILCFMEVSNDNANKDTDLRSFFEHGTLTFFKKGWVVI